MGSVINKYFDVSSYSKKDVLIKNESGIEVKIKYNEEDKELIKKIYEVVLNTEKLFVYLKYKNEKDEECFRVAKILQKTKIYLTKAEETQDFYLISKTSNFELKEKNLKLKNNQHIKQKFYDIIDDFDVLPTTKTMFKERVIDCLAENLPFLYEEDGNKKWIIPDFKNNEDIVLDYNKDIPVILDRFDDEVLSGLSGNTRFNVISNNGITAYNLRLNHSLIVNVDLPKGFVFTLERSGEYKKNIIQNPLSLSLKRSEVVEEVVTLKFPTFYTLNEEETKKLLILNKSEMSLEDVKNNIIKYNIPSKDTCLNNITEHITDPNINLLSFNTTFISEKVNDFNKVLIEYNSKSENLKKVQFWYVNSYLGETDSLLLTNMHINYNLSSKYNLNINYNKFVLKEGEIEKNLKTYLKKPVIFSVKNRKKIFLPKNKGVLYNEETNLDNTKLRFSEDNESYLFVEDNYLVTKGDEFRKNINFVLDLNVYDLKQKLAVKEGSSYRNSNRNLGHNNEMLLFHNYNNDLILIDKDTKKSKIIDNSEIFEYLNPKITNSLNLKTDYSYFNIYLTQNKTLYFFNKNKDINEIDNIREDQGFGYVEKEKINNNYQIEVSVPTLKTQNEWEFKFKPIKTPIMKQNKIENNEMIYKVIGNDKEKYQYKKINYLINDNILNSINFSREDYRNIANIIEQVQISNLTLNKEESKIFFKNIFGFENDIYLSLKKEAENTELSLLNKKRNQQIVLSQNSNYDFNFISNIERDLPKTNLLKLYKNKKLNGVKKHLESGNMMYYTKSKIYILQDIDTELTIIDNYHYQNSVKNPKSFLNSKEFIFNNENNEEILIMFNDKKYNGLFNISKENVMKDKIKNYDISI